MFNVLASRGQNINKQPVKDNALTSNTVYAGGNVKAFSIPNTRSLVTFAVIAVIIVAVFLRK